MFTIEYALRHSLYPRQMTSRRLSSSSDDFQIKLANLTRLYYRVYCDSEVEIVGHLPSLSSFLLLRSCWNQIFSLRETMSTSRSCRELQPQTCNVALRAIGLSSRVRL